ncbi:hypothetical protein BUALT_Bualt01G0170700 [Buddleja alternifolia]|uniref:AN1-type domain-containing protein n=1 Tax=Buddleja alternifolia TaxID=168488 RepID=A0AAV6Y7Y1_9LAMI|nr:hypothetical protein BUALT_Bualt01G0170700 [Buddleja alternifolia]
MQVEGKGKSRSEWAAGAETQTTPFFTLPAISHQEEPLSIKLFPLGVHGSVDKDGIHKANDRDGALRRGLHSKVRFEKVRRDLLLRSAFSKRKTENEETEFKVVVPETITICVKCGVAANSATNNLCQKCFNAAAAASTSAAASPTSLNPNSFRSGSSTRSSPERKFNSVETRRDLKIEADAAPPVKREVNRCSGCRRKVGLTGFRCRCGDLFCAEHRYSDRHDCSYDYKTSGRDAIARENPVVKAAKLVKI